jgi:uncharacterized protein YecT (DUF1311 family)
MAGTRSGKAIDWLRTGRGWRAGAWCLAGLLAIWATSGTAQNPPGAPPPDSAVPEAETQAGMNEEAEKSFLAAEREMKRALDSLLARKGASPDAVQKLERAQNAWLAYRDAQLEADFPFPDKGAYGSVYPMCAVGVKEGMTRDRTQELQAMLKPEEGDVCASRWPD